MHIVRIAVVAAGLAAGIGSARADNLIVNPNFNGDVGGWTAGVGVNISWDATQDANGSPASGALAEFPASGNTFNLSAFQCFAVTGGSDFSFGAKVKPGTATGFGMTCTAYASLDCSGKPVGNASAIIAGPPDQNGWVALHTESPYLLPGLTQSVSCAIAGTLPPPPIAGASQPNGVSTTLWADDVFFAPGTTPVTLQGFDID